MAIHMMAGAPGERSSSEGEHRPLKTLFSRGTIASWRLFVMSLHPPLFAIPATGFEGPAEPISFTFALIIVAEGNLEPLYIGPRWTSSIVPGGPLNMAFDPPGPQSNPPIRDFLWEQEVVATYRPRLTLAFRRAPCSGPYTRSPRAHRCFSCCSYRTPTCRD